MRTFSAAFFALLLGASLMVASTGWAQTSAPPAPGTQTAPEPPKTTQPGGSVSGTPGAPSTTAPGAPSTTAPGTRPGTGTTTSSEGRIPATPGDQATDGRVFGMSRTTAIVLGLVILGVIVALVAMSRRDRDVFETPVDRDVRVYDRDRDVLDDRDRPRRVS